MKSICIRLIFVIVILSLSEAACAQATGKFGPRGLFAYVAQVEAEPGKYFTGPYVSSPEQMTTLFPKSDHFDGVVLLLYWSLLNPQKDQYSFEQLDAALAYWKARGKHVGLAVATVGWPVRMSSQFGGSIVNATPDWVMREVKTFTNSSRTFDYQQAREELAEFPLYWDEQFVQHSVAFIRELGRRYGNHPAVSFVRIASGVLGEDQPSTSRNVNTGIPGFTVGRWLNYVKRISGVYRQAFPDKPLEYDLVRTGLFLARGTDAEKAAAREFIHFLGKNSVVLGYNGVREEDPRLLEDPKYYDFHIFRLLKSYYKEFGIPASLEMYGPPQGPKMKNTERIFSLIDDVRPLRVVFFGQTAAVLNMAEGKLDPKVDTPAWRYFELAWNGEAESQAMRNLRLVQQAKNILWNYR